MFAQGGGRPRSAGDVLSSGFRAEVHLTGDRTDATDVGVAKQVSTLQGVGFCNGAGANGRSSSKAGVGGRGCSRGTSAASQGIVADAGQTLDGGVRSDVQLGAGHEAAGVVEISQGVGIAAVDVVSSGLSAVGGLTTDGAYTTDLNGVEVGALD